MSDEPKVTGPTAREVGELFRDSGRRPYSRIEEILEVFKRVWKLCPDMRFCQLIMNCAETNRKEGQESDVFYVEDDVFLDMMKAYEKLLWQKSKS